MSEYTPRHSEYQPNERHHEHLEQPERRDDEPAVGFDPEHFPARPGIWAADDSEAMTGQWIDATLEPVDIETALDGRAIYDTIGFGTFVLEPGENPEVISRVARGIQEHGPAFAAWAQFHDADPDMLAVFREQHLGSFANLAELGRNLIEASGWSIEQIPEPIRPWVRIEYAAAAQHEIAVSTLVLLPGESEQVHLFRGPDREADP
ncbi:antirestriction protein ArdA [Leekyejoonella antrihumi]|uniref:Antirestriction protein ArdA n=1 Tax=Leekyejoonella antrihumi TaxID=1660198 RepID=A0A563DW49_9MICO|nr:antirestriction protein ArdA [Leekyejoonella antrihumi]TWP34339.1 antirestriction protein ArdA [Leekyejoonella antrihumi]